MCLSRYGWMNEALTVQWVDLGEGTPLFQPKVPCLGVHSGNLHAELLAVVKTDTWMMSETLWLTCYHGNSFCSTCSSLG